MSKRSGARRARPKMTAAERRRRDAARKRREYWADPVKARAKGRAKRQRRLEHYRAKEREAHRRNIAKELAWARRSVARYRERHPAVIAAWEATKAVIRRGELAVATTCEALGCNQTTGLHVHHNTYENPTRPSSITSLCRDHHRRCHVDGRVKLRAGASRRWARAPQHQQANHANH